MLHRFQTRALVASLAVMLGFSAVYLLTTAEGRATLLGVRRLVHPAALATAELVVPTPSPGRPAVIYWIASDGLWSWQPQVAATPLHERIEQLSNLVLDRLGLDLLVIQAMVGDDDVAYLFFSVASWEPSARDETDLTQSILRTVLSDVPWLTGIRFVLPSRHLDYSTPLRRWDRGYDPLITKTRSTDAREEAR